ncbi:SRPBCC domain-containing protein [Ruegeria sp. HKCCD8929]|uniref:SRPBCC domain-containing protein n=1 Tax=Ruegeria sp. HKCCD8929 TaxID=2683006 RepID=UPI001487A398|nr:SRPBCC domain-containing protein [Ruegeria sp. HKCCD8929]
MTDPIVKTVEVNCSAARAFEVFVTRISDWWPLDGHAVSAASGKPAQSVTIEPRVGGAVYETMHDGGRTDWGKVLEFEPGRSLAMTWHPGNNADAPTRVQVEFADAGGKTRVTLTHSGWEVWGAEAAAKRGNYDSGWDFVFGERYTGAIAA